MGARRAGVVVWRSNSADARDDATTAAYKTTVAARLAMMKRVMITQTSSMANSLGGTSPGTLPEKATSSLLYGEWLSLTFGVLIE
jgi:hypothetical protein